MYQPSGFEKLIPVGGVSLAYTYLDLIEACDKAEVYAPCTLYRDDRGRVPTSVVYGDACEDAEGARACIRDEQYDRALMGIVVACDAVSLHPGIRGPGRVSRRVASAEGVPAL